MLMTDIQTSALQNGGIDLTIVYISNARMVVATNQLRFTIDFTSRDDSWSMAQRELVRFSFFFHFISSCSYFF